MKRIDFKTFRPVGETVSHLLSERELNRIGYGTMTDVVRRFENVEREVFFIRPLYFWATAKDGYFNKTLSRL